MRKSWRKTSGFRVGILTQETPRSRLWLNTEASDAEAEVGCKATAEGSDRKVAA
jgi:hypothetical protein